MRNLGRGVLAQSLVFAEFHHKRIMDKSVFRKGRGGDLGSCETQQWKGGYGCPLGGSA